MHGLVGANNAGKSSILRGLDFLFNPSASKVNEETFWNGDISLTIWVEATFTDLTEEEREKLLGYLRPNGDFQMARSARLTTEGTEDAEASATEGKAVISQHFCMPMPKAEWLRPSEVSGANIDRWWKSKEHLVIHGNRFADFVGNNKPNVSVWKDHALKFAKQVLQEGDYEDVWADNPKGYAGVLKGTLPFFILVPAVRDVTEEARVTKTNPLGRILYSVIANVTDTQRQALTRSLDEVKCMLNRDGGELRLPCISETEKRLNEVLREYMDCELEIEFQPPSLELLLTNPRIFADDGFRNVAENKGHGLQRAIIFSILRCYSELVTGAGKQKKRTVVFAVEEPELYMHPQAQRAMRRVFRRVADGGDQVLFSTHSPLLLDVAYFDEIIRVEGLQHSENGDKTVMSKVWQLTMESLIVDLKARYPSANPTPTSMREHYANAYHPMRAEGFFAKKVILVEGATEQYSLPIFAEAAGCLLDAMNIAVVDCGGKGPMDRLYRIFNELGIPCYLVFDYDKSSSDSDTIRTSKELLSLIGENIEPPDQVLVTERVTCFPENWERDLAAQIPGYEALATKARQSLGVARDSGKPLVARHIARSLADLQPPVIPPCILSGLRNAIALEWKGSCLRG